MKSALVNYKKNLNVKYNFWWYFPYRQQQANRSFLQFHVQNNSFGNKCFPKYKNNIEKNGDTTHTRETQYLWFLKLIYKWLLNIFC